MIGVRDATIEISDAELETTLQKACVGVGLDLGNGIELGRAALTLRYAGMDSAPVFAAALRKYTPRNADTDRDSLNDLMDRAKIADALIPISAISAASAICDWFITESNPEIRLRLDCPLIVLALLATRGCCGEMAFEGDAGKAAFHDHTIGFQGLASSFATVPGTIELKHRSTRNSMTVDRGRSGIRDVDAASWRDICALADRCLVSGSEESRLNDAGAGLIDED